MAGCQQNDGVDSLGVFPVFHAIYRRIVLFFGSFLTGNRVLVVEGEDISGWVARVKGAGNISLKSLQGTAGVHGDEPLWCYPTTYRRSGVGRIEP